MCEDIVSCSSAISINEKCSEWKQALLLLRCAQRTLKLDCVACSAATSACAAASVTQWRAAVQLASPGELKLGPIACNTAITACERVSCWVLALVALDQLHQPRRSRRRSG
eukprot:g19413.t1